MRLEEYFHYFSKAGYDMPTISRMTPEDLTAIGVTKPAHRKQLKAEINKLCINDGIPDYKPIDLHEWLRLLSLGEYYESLIYQGYEMLDSVVDITWEDLEEIGISKLGHQKKIMLAIERIKRLLTHQRSSSVQTERKNSLEILEPVSSYSMSNWSKPITKSHHSLPPHTKTVLPEHSTSNTGSSDQIENSLNPLSTVPVNHLHSGANFQSPGAPLSTSAAGSQPTTSSFIHGHTESSLLVSKQSPYSESQNPNVVKIAVNPMQTPNKHVSAEPHDDGQFSSFYKSEESVAQSGKIPQSDSRKPEHYRPSAVVSPSPKHRPIAKIVAASPKLVSSRRQQFNRSNEQLLDQESELPPPPPPSLNPHEETNEYRLNPVVLSNVREINHKIPAGYATLSKKSSLRKKSENLLQEHSILEATPNSENDSISLTPSGIHPETPSHKKQTFDINNREVPQPGSPLPGNRRAPPPPPKRTHSIRSSTKLLSKQKSVGSLPDNQLPVNSEELKIVDDDFPSPPPPLHLNPSPLNSSVREAPYSTSPPPPPAPPISNSEQQNLSIAEARNEASAQSLFDGQKVRSQLKSQPCLNTHKPQQQQLSQQQLQQQPQQHYQQQQEQRQHQQQKQTNPQHFESSVSSEINNSLNEMIGCLELTSSNTSNLSFNNVSRADRPTAMQLSQTNSGPTASSSNNTSSTFSACTLTSTSSTSGLVSGSVETLPFANENVGTIKQRTPTSKSSILSIGETDEMGERKSVLNSSLFAVTSSHLAHSSTDSTASIKSSHDSPSHAHVLTKDTSLKKRPPVIPKRQDSSSNFSINQSQPAEKPNDVLNDIGNMLQDLTDELDAMLDHELTS